MTEMNVNNSSKEVTDMTEITTDRPLPMFDPNTEPDRFTKLYRAAVDFGELHLHGKGRPPLSPFIRVPSLDVDGTAFRNLGWYWDWFCDTRDAVLSLPVSLPTAGTSPGDATRQVIDAALRELLNQWEEYADDYATTLADRSPDESDRVCGYDGMSGGAVGAMLLNLEMATDLNCYEQTLPSTFTITDMREPSVHEVFMDYTDDDLRRLLAELVEKNWLTELEPGNRWRIVPDDLAAAWRTHRI